ncbi:MAG TPA: glycoside hydrolase [Treponema sp.]|nr:glycoside hydrolase [Treponema sp.]
MMLIRRDYMKKNIRTGFALALFFAAGIAPLYAGGRKDKPADANDAAAPVETVEASPEDNMPEEEPLPVPQDIDWSKSRLSYVPPKIEGEPVAFKEVWGYVMTDRESAFSNDMPITDLCYFSADVNSYGELSFIPNPARFSSYKGRLHLVITCSGRALTHFSMDPAGKERRGILDAIAAAAKKYDGIQVDYETIGGRDAENFLLFLKAIRERIGPNKILSVALPARTRTLRDDIFDYNKIAPIVDRIIVMAYDEHWSGSKPGPVASMDWCRRVAEYCVKTLPREKLVMGLPFYGRSWQNNSYGSAWIYTSMNRVMKEQDVHSVSRTGSVAHFSFDTKVHVEAYFDDAYSLVVRSRMYKDMGVANVGFWRIGQEDVDYWPWLKIEK